MYDKIDVHERLSRLEQWSVHADKRMDQLAVITEGLVRGLRWVTIALVTLVVLLFGDRLLPLVTAFAGK